MRSGSALCAVPPPYRELTSARRCRAIPGCTTRTTLANRAAHETACLAAHDEIAQLKNSVDEKRASYERSLTEIARLSKVALKYDELRKKRAGMIDSSTATDKEVVPVVKADITAQAVKRSLRLASKRGAPEDSPSHAAGPSTFSSAETSTSQASRPGKARRTDA